MNRILSSAALALVMGGVAFAGTDEILLTSQDASNNTVQQQFTGGLNTVFEGWDIHALVAQSDSPNTVPLGIGLDSIKVTCVSLSGCNALSIAYSDVGFTGPIGDLSEAVSGTIKGSGYVNQQAWFDPNNVLFGNQDTATDSLGLLGGVAGFTNNGPFSATQNNAVSLDASSTFSLTIEQTFQQGVCSSPGTCTTYTVNGNITDPMSEPASMFPESLGLVLMTGVLLWARRAIRQRASN